MAARSLYSLLSCPFLTTPHTPDSAHPTSQTNPNTLAFRNGSAPRYISVRSGTFKFL
ncbi:hypothetical protein C8J57DRAFT_1520830 [Mycena rebaudengoi]|nr:hypothetical protein C8J57DRAFT_1520830 [Mycena rebaudengoi]